MQPYKKRLFNMTWLTKTSKKQHILGLNVEFLLYKYKIVWYYSRGKSLNWYCDAARFRLYTHIYSHFLVNITA